jgi:primosomal protein N' (replication factor Y)
MQTYNPDHFIIEASRKQDFHEFFHNEAPFRKALMYPPFSRMTQLKISGHDSGKVKAYAETVESILKGLLENEDLFKGKVQVLGPVEAPIQRISSRFRWQILVKSPSAALVNRLVKTTLDHPDAKPKSGITLSVDVDPYFLM